MNSNTSRILLKMSGSASIVYGILWSITIIGLIVGIPLIIGGNKFIEASKKSDTDLGSAKNDLVLWSILMVFFAFPVGIISLFSLFII